MVGTKRVGWELLLCVLLFGAALAVRVYDLAEIPPGLWLDEAAYGLDALDVQQGQYAIFFPRNNGREPLFIYWQALMMSLLGATPYVLRLGAALLGAATVPATYWLVRTLFREGDLPSFWLALWVALLLTFGYWHIALSRVGFRAITLPLVATLSLLFFGRAWPRVERAGKLPWVDLLLCGALVGATLYTYTAGRFIPLVVLLAVAGGLLTAHTDQERRRRFVALLVIGLSAALVFAPLGFYFLRHPEYFLAHAGEVSILSPTYAGNNPLWALASSAWKTAQMFVILPDANLRHNPAGRPLFDLPLAGWLVVGIGVALWRWRSLPYRLTLLWFGLLSLPAMLTSQGVPHSLRSLGMVPAAYILPVLGMAWVGQWGRGRWARLALWLPLPFIFFSSVGSVGDYFGAWQDWERLRKPFLIDYAQIATRIVQQSAPNTVWLLPLPTSYVLEGGVWPFFYTFEFFFQQQVRNGTVVASEAQAPSTLALLTRDQHFASVFHLREHAFSTDYYTIDPDVKNLVEFLLQKHGRLISQSDGADVGLPYARYELPQQARFSVTAAPISATIRFADKVQLVALDYGRTMLDPAEPEESRAEQRAPAGHPLWAVLRWQAQTALDFDLKSSLLLKDEVGHLAGQVDTLLVGDHYPALRLWEAGEAASTYHILPTLPAIAPGRYQLYLKVYEDSTGRIYPATDDAGQSLGTEVALGTVEITPSVTTPPITPTVALSADLPLAPNLALLGFDLPRSQVAPGDKLLLTLYWQALAGLGEDYLIRLRLRATDGATLVEQTMRPGNDSYATNQWHAGTQVRDWRDLQLPVTAPAGSYELLVSVLKNNEAVGEKVLGAVEVKGRPRLFTPPLVAQPISATFGAQVQLLGVDTPTPLTLTPGGTLPLTLTWQVLANAPAPLIRFVHLLNEAGQPVAQQDAAPCNGECPATSWLVDEILVDLAFLTLPADLSAGNYRLAVGWYAQETQQRLTGLEGAGQPLTDQILLLPVDVVVR